MYSDISKRKSSIPIVRANCTVTSVLPTPVGPANKNEPTGLLSALNPARLSLIASVNTSIALSWPKTNIFNLLSRLCSTSRSLLEIDFSGIRAILAIMASISATLTVFLRRLAGAKRQRAPASSITSIALSGK